MPENLDPAPELEQQPSAETPDEIKLDFSSPESLDVSQIPDELPKENVAGLKSAFEKIKAQLNELKPLKAKSDILDQLTTQGISPDQIPAKLAELKRQEVTAQEVERQIAQVQAREAAEREQLTQAYQSEIAKLNDTIQKSRRKEAYESVLSIAGGSAADYEDFSSIASRFIEFDENQGIKSFKAPDGKTLYVNDDTVVGKVKPATAYDFVLKIKKGDYGRALQAIVPALNQATGSGLPSSVGIGGDGVLRITQAELNNMGQWPPNDPRLKAVRANKIQIIG